MVYQGEVLRGAEILRSTYSWAAAVRPVGQGRHSPPILWHLILTS